MFTELLTEVNVANLVNTEEVVAHECGPPQRIAPASVRLAGAITSCNKVAGRTLLRAVGGIHIFCDNSQMLPEIGGLRPDHATTAVPKNAVKPL